MGDVTSHDVDVSPQFPLALQVKIGVNTVRIPVGFWIVDSPVDGSSPLEYGFSPEGFVTGGLNHLSEMLKKLAERNIKALIDMHCTP